MRVMRRPSLVQCCPYRAAGGQLAADRAALAALKKDCRRELRRIGVHPRAGRGALIAGQNDRLVLYGKSREDAWRDGERARRAPGGQPALLLRDTDCEVNFDATSKVTTIAASAWIDRPLGELARVVDPRAWGLSAGVIDVAFPVTRQGGEYEPIKEDLDVPLGKALRNGERMLLFEYARSEIASFENILSIDTFSVTRNQIQVTYHLVDCLKTTIGFLSIDGGLQRNDGSVRVTPATADVNGRARRGSLIEVTKCIRVRDLTPNDPGNRYDFGESLNATLGSALSLWVDDTSMMSPVF